MSSIMTHKYDMKDNYSSELKLSKNELIKEIAEDKLYMTSTFKKVFHINKSSSSIQDELLRKLNIDLNYYMGKGSRVDENSRKQRYDCFRFLKLIYMIEKQGEPIQKNSFYVPDRSNEKKRIPILDIISVPHLDNISFGFSVDDYKISSAYNSIIDKLSDELANALHYTEEVKNEKIRQIEEMDSSWLYLTSFLCFNSEDVKNNEAYSEYRLSRISEYVEKQLLGKIDIEKASRFEYDCGIFQIMFNYLICHRMLCKQAEIIANNYDIINEPRATKEYADIFMESKGKTLNVEDTIARLKSSLIVSGSDDCSELWNLITYGEGKESLKPNRISYSLDKVTRIVEWIKQCVKSNIHKIPYWAVEQDDQEITEWQFVSIVQELYYSDWSTIITNSWFGNKNKNKKSLGSALKTNPDQVTLQAWIFRIENRTIVNLNAYDYLRKRRELEKLFYKLKVIMFSTHTPEDMHYISDYYNHFLKRYVLLSEGQVVELFRHQFNEVWKNQLNPDIINDVNFCTYNGLKAWRILSMEFEPQKLYSFFGDISQKIQENGDDIEDITFSMRFETDGISDFDEGLWIDFDYSRQQKLLTFKNCIEIGSDEATERLLDLGFNQMITKKNAAIGLRE